MKRSTVLGCAMPLSQLCHRLGTVMPPLWHSCDSTMALPWHCCANGYEQLVTVSVSCCANGLE
ncbi:hypothetical protein [Bacteroides reticulotermitis]|uniref:hypothetical protein n=1 Tax=Bacteroides reticulotermitis TaxID=1133319 RepID=UPI003A8A2CC8